MSTIADIAASEYRRRAAKADQAVADRRVRPEETNTLLRPWKALAILAGADLPGLAEDMADLRETHIRPIAGISRDVTEAEARALLAAEIQMGRPGQPRVNWKTALAAALRQAWDALPEGRILPGSADDRKAAYFRDLRALAEHFGLFVDLPPRANKMEKAA